MSTLEVTPSAVPSGHASAPTLTGSYTLRPSERRLVHTLRVPIPKMPAELRLSLEVGSEADGVWARIPELDVSAEGSDVAEAMKGVLAAAREWLAYLRDEAPELTPELADQRRYVELLDLPYIQFRAYSFVAN
jgi:hypothetical protein